ncbi:YfjI family protein, partial [Acinetobacter baumannii]|nr:YfjI family protein [Acinetobacter baumannii]
AQCVIGAMSHIAQAKVNAPDRFKAHGEPCSLFLLTEGQSGSRKSTSKNLADRAILDYERKQYEIYQTELEQWKSGQAGLPKKDREAYSAENPPPNDPSTRYSDITLESIAGLFIDGILQNASISSDEAGQFFGGHTMKADTRNQALGGYTKLFDDGYVER